MSGCCFNQVESGLCTDLQLVERPVKHMGFIMGLGPIQSGTIVFPLLLLNWNSFLSLCLTHTPLHVHTHTQNNNTFQPVCFGNKRKILKLFDSSLIAKQVSVCDISENTLFLSAREVKQKKLSGNYCLTIDDIVYCLKNYLI